MDLMDIRRMLMMIAEQGGGDMGNWNQKTITVPSNMSLTSEVKAWLNTSGVIPSCNFGVAIIDKEITSANVDDFVFVPIVNGSATVYNGTNGFYGRTKGSTTASRYLQTRSFGNEETCNVYQGDTFTIFYL